MKQAGKTNPFIRGYDSYRVERTLMIIYDAYNNPPAYRVLHASQSPLSDGQIQLHPCSFNDQEAVITEGQAVDPELLDSLPGDGVVVAVVYSIHASDQGADVHLGDVGSLEHANEIIQRHVFRTGHFSRCWEISIDHISESSATFLNDVANTGQPSGMYFEVSWLDGQFGLCVKLIATPWSKDHLAQFDIDPMQLEDRWTEAGVPDDLVHLLKLAAAADTRILILCPAADHIEGLPIFDHK